MHSLTRYLFSCFQNRKIIFTFVRCCPAQKQSHFILVFILSQLHGSFHLPLLICEGDGWMIVIRITSASLFFVSCTDFKSKCAIALEGLGR